MITRERRSFIWASRLVFGLAFAILAIAARAQDKGYDVTSYDVNLRVLRTENALEGAVTMHAKTTRALQHIELHLKDLQIDSVFVNGAKATVAPLDTTDEDGRFTIVNASPIPASSEFTATTFYHGAPSNEGGTNPWGGVINNGQMMFAMGVGFSAPYVSCTRFWMPCYDEPDDKADSVTMTFVINDSDVVASNGLRVFDEDDATTHLRTTTWKVSHPIATYLLTFATGPFVELNRTTPSGTPIQGFCYKSDSARLAVEFTRRIVRTIALYDSLFGPYPFEKVGYVVAPIGSMEHQTMITLINQAIDTNSTTPQHELAHMWWGDWVTCKDFNDPWLNEGFATFCESLVLEHDISPVRYWIKQRGNISGAISGGSTIPMYGAPFLTSPRDNYPYGVIYQKGAAVLGMLRYILGDSIFFPALRSYGAAHAYGNATSYDLLHDLEAFTGQDLHWFFKQWVFGIWYPQLKVSWRQTGSSYTVNLDQVQDSTMYQFFRTPIVIEARTKGGLKDRAVVLMDSVAHSSASVICPFVPDTIVVDPDGALIKKIVSVTTLGVAPAVPSKVDARYALRFDPNPARSGAVRLTVSALPYVHNAFLDEGSYLLDRLAELTSNHAELMLFDSNGREIYHMPISRPESVEQLLSSVSYVYTIPSTPIASGTYFAKLVLNNLIVGEAQLVVTK